MQDLPTCSKCGQDEEYLISETGGYVCICGHQFEGHNIEANKESTSIFNRREEKTNAYQATYQHRKTTLLH
ncbi:hypothetical protein [Photobacterium rosenbergii]|uniref:hypothetical protein n=1 Tax=Photobacterium rosenbergii TaxID=294936 RepID=UPI001C9A08F4|nr:hypothetical protein [Photobacterium rosenbergii]MBY5946877.1 hypothetical protein [Photobacterium rosenbergii]